MELAHLPYKKETYEDYVGIRGLKQHGKKRWRRHVVDVIERLIATLKPDVVVLGGGNVKKLPRGCRAGDTANALIGGFRLWAHADGGHDLLRRPVPHEREAEKAMDQVIDSPHPLDGDCAKLEPNRQAERNRCDSHGTCLLSYARNERRARGSCMPKTRIDALRE